jgi:hypothetical protein
MKRYSIIHIPAWSFFSKSLYHDVCHEWKGFGFVYLLLLLAVCWTAPIVKLHMVVSDFVDNDAPKIVSQIPVISIVEGKVSIDEPQPYHIREPEKGETLVVIDTTGAITSLEDMEAIVLITETQVIYRESDIETRTFSLEGVKDVTLDQDVVTGWLAVGKKYVALAFYVLALLGSFVGRIIQMLIYAAIGILFSSLCKSERTYAQLLRLSVVAVTPCIIIKTLLGAAQTSVPYAGVWYFLVAMGYLFFGVKAASVEGGPTSEAPVSEFPRTG